MNARAQLGIEVLILSRTYNLNAQRNIWAIFPHIYICLFNVYSRLCMCVCAFCPTHDFYYSNLAIAYMYN